MRSVDWINSQKYVLWTIKGSFDHQCFATMIDFFYSGQLNITTVNSVGLLEVADLLLLEATRRSLINYLQQTLNCDNCVWYRTVGQVWLQTQRFFLPSSLLKRPVFKFLDFAQLWALCGPWATFTYYNVTLIFLEFLALWYSTLLCVALYSFELFFCFKFLCVTQKHELIKMILNRSQP